MVGLLSILEKNMAATHDRQAEESLKQALDARLTFHVAENENRDARVRFIRDAKAAGWSWARMGRALDITESAVRRFWRDNRMAATRLGGKRAGAQTVVAETQEPAASHQRVGGAGKGTAAAERQA